METPPFCAFVGDPWHLPREYDACNCGYVVLLVQQRGRGMAQFQDQWKDLFLVCYESVLFIDWTSLINFGAHATV